MANTATKPPLTTRDYFELLWSIVLESLIAIVLFLVMSIVVATFMVLFVKPLLVPTVGLEAFNQIGSGVTFVAGIATLFTVNVLSSRRQRRQQVMSRQHIINTNAQMFADLDKDLDAIAAKPKSQP